MDVAEKMKAIATHSKVRHTFMSLVSWGGSASDYLHRDSRAQALASQLLEQDSQIAVLQSENQGHVAKIKEMSVHNQVRAVSRTPSPPDCFGPHQSSVPTPTPCTSHLMWFACACSVLLQS